MTTSSQPDPAAAPVRAPARAAKAAEVGAKAKISEGPLPGASEVPMAEHRLTVHALEAEGRVFHREIELPQPVEPDTVNVTYRNGVLDVTLRRVSAHRIRFKRGT